MPHVSKRRLKKDIYNRVHEDFAELLVEICGYGNRDAFVQELLTKTERLMLGKRLATVLMLMKGYSAYRVERTLKLTEQTVRRFNRNIRRGRYVMLVENLDRIMHKRKKGNLHRNARIWASFDVKE